MSNVYLTHVKGQYEKKAYPIRLKSSGITRHGTKHESI